MLRKEPVDLITKEGTERNNYNKTFRTQFEINVKPIYFKMNNYVQTDREKSPTLE